MIAISVCSLGSVEDESSPHMVAVWQLGGSQGSEGNKVQLPCHFQQSGLVAGGFFLFVFSLLL